MQFCEYVSLLCSWKSCQVLDLSDFGPENVIMEWRVWHWQFTCDVTWWWLAPLSVWCHCYFLLKCGLICSASFLLGVLKFGLECKMFGVWEHFLLFMIDLFFWRCKCAFICVVSSESFLTLITVAIDISLMHRFSALGQHEVCLQFCCLNTFLFTRVEHSFFLGNCLPHPNAMTVCWKNGQYFSCLLGAGQSVLCFCF